VGPVRVGYIRTSKKDQNPELQRRDLLAAGYEKAFEERISSRKAARRKRPPNGAGGDRARTPIRAIRAAHGSYGADKDRGRDGDRGKRVLVLGVVSPIRLDL
jgi:Resolvase, N terminal domain